MPRKPTIAEQYAPVLHRCRTVEESRRVATLALTAQRRAILKALRAERDKWCRVWEESNNPSVRADALVWRNGVEAAIAAVRRVR